MACARSDEPGAAVDGDAAVLLFTGRGTSPSDVKAIEGLLRANSFGYATASSSRLDAMTAEQLRTHRLLIVPGGNFVEMGNGLAAATATHVRDAIGGGLNYLGICGGAFIAGDSPFNGFNLTSGVRFPFYSAEEHGIRKAAVTIAAAGMPAVEHYWEDGPQLTGWGEVVAKYPDGTPAVVQGAFGQGHVILTGTHPEAPENWRRGLGFTTPATAANAYAVTLIDAAANRRPLAHF